MQQQRVTLNAEIVRIFGCFALIIAAACCVLLIANIRARFHYGARDFSFLGYIAAYAIIAGWATVRLKRWGAVMLVAPVAIAGVLLGFFAIRQQQTVGVAAIAISWIALFSVPAIFCVRSWRDLN
jgi:hypothetical protein